MIRVTNSMRYLAILYLAASAVFLHSATAQTTTVPPRPQHHRVTAQASKSNPNARINRVPENAVGGKPGTANSANPAPNVPPLQTPSQPVSGSRP